MANLHRILEAMLRGTSDANIWFADLCKVLEWLGFSKRMGKGDHHIFAKEGVVEILNLQPRRDGKAKPYQVRQARSIILKYRIGEPSDEI